MDFFANAHVLKKQPFKKESKSEENMKKQLKQMLYGYKKSDNELIKSSANANINANDVHKGFDDSTSVSGFSDLNLTISDDEADVSRVTISRELQDAISNNSDESSRHSSDIEQLDDITKKSNDSASNIETQLETILEDTQESITEDNEDIDSLSEDIEFSESSVSDTDDFSFKCSLDTEVRSDDIDSEFGSSGSDSEFDPDGSLACKIFERLEQKDVCTKKGKKRKLEHSYKTAVPQNTAKQDGSKKQNKNDCDIEIENLNINTDTRNSSSPTNNDDTQDSVSTNQSSAFISITATEMPNQSLSEILGEYRHPTVKNLPSEKQNLYSTNNSGIFASDEMQVEDVDSLIPELGDAETIDFELDLDTTDMPIEESTTVYDTIQSESEIESTDKHFVNPVKVFYGNNCCVFVLKHPTELYVNGKVNIKPLGGTIEVLGYTLKDEVKLYAPNYNYAHCVKTVENINAYNGLFSKLTSAGLTVAEAEDIVTTLGDYDGVISMSPLNDKKIDFVENNFSTADLFTKPNKNIDSYLRKASLRLRCSLYLTRPWRFFEENESWNEAVTCGLNENSRGIVCGGKGMGKSTFLRYYVNKMLENGPVLVIDLDPGQAEFTVAGNVSAIVVTKPLLGPNFTHLQTPDIQLNVGMINVMDNTVRYAAAVCDLLAQCRARAAYSTLPWIINTMGMSNHMGLKLVTLTIIHAQPTFLLQIDSKIAKRRFDCQLRSNNVTQLYNEEYKNDRLFRNVQCLERLEYNFLLTQHVGGTERYNSSMSAKDERYLNFLAYFGELLCSHNKEDLLGIVPYEVKLSDLMIVTNVKVASEAVGKVINGKVVALCQLAPADKGAVFTLGDKPLRCYGHGLVRGVDLEKGTVYVLTPTAGGRLPEAGALLYADWAPELAAARGLPPGTPVPYRTATVQQHKQLMLSPRRRFNPLQFLKMTRSA